MTFLSIWIMSINFSIFHLVFFFVCFPQNSFASRSFLTLLGNLCNFKKDWTLFHFLWSSIFSVNIVFDINGSKNSLSYPWFLERLLKIFKNLSTEEASFLFSNSKTTFQSVLNRSLKRSLSKALEELRNYFIHYLPVVIIFVKRVETSLFFIPILLEN